jgi:hypothetical protein
LEVLAAWGADHVVAETGVGDLWDGQWDLEVVVGGVFGSRCSEWRAGEGFLATIEDLEVIVLAEFESRVEIFEDRHAGLRFEKADVLKGLAHFAFDVQTGDGSLYIAFAKHTVDTRECLCG